MRGSTLYPRAKASCENNESHSTSNYESRQKIMKIYKLQHNQAPSKLFPKMCKVYKRTHIFFCVVFP